MKYLKYFLVFILYCNASFCFAKDLPRHPGNIHVFGDSHARNNFNRIQKCMIHSIGAITMNRIGRDKIDFFNVSRYGVQENDTCIFVFGEIDIRCHVLKQRDLFQRNVDEILSTLAKNYMSTILQNKAQYKNLHCIVCGILPPTNMANNPNFPIHGSLAARMKTTKKLNQNLKRLCKQHNLKFMSLYKEYALNGALNPALSDGNVHIGGGQNGTVKKKLSKLLLKMFPRKKSSLKRSRR